MPDVMSNAGLHFSVILPELVMVIFALLVMVADMFAGEERSFLPWIALAGVVVSGLICVGQWSQPVNSFQGMAITDSFALGLDLIIVVATGLAILLSAGYIQHVNPQTGEYYALLLLCAAGMMMMGSATDLIVVFLALEILSL